MLQRHLGFSLVFSLVLVAYLRGVTGWLAGGDSPELVIAALSGGVAHPPGYPLQTLLGMLSQGLSPLDPVVTAHALSAIFGALAAAALAALAQRLGLGWLGCAWASLGFAFSPLIWRYSTIAEVFALNHLLVAGFLLACVGTQDRPDAPARIPWLASWFLGGLALGHHQTSIAFVLPALGWLAWKERGTGARGWTFAAAAFGLSFLPFLHLPLAASKSIPDVWGDHATLSGFLAHVTRAEYGTFSLGVRGLGATGRLGEGLARYFSELPQSLGYAGLAAAVVGVGVAAATRRRAFLALAGAWAIYVTGFHALANLPLSNPFFLETQRRFWMLSYLPLFLLAGLGADQLLRRSRGLALALSAGAAGAIFASSPPPQSDVVHRYARAVLASLPPGSLFLSRGELATFSARALQLALGLRPDAWIVDRELLTTEWSRARFQGAFPGLALPGARLQLLEAEPNRPGGYRLADLFRANLGTRPIVITGFFDGEDRGWEAGFTTWPWGVHNRVYTGGAAFDVEGYIRETDPIVRAFEGIRVDSPREGSWEHAVLYELREVDLRRGHRLVAHASEIREKDSAAARFAVEHGLRILRAGIPKHPAPAPVLHETLRRGETLARELGLLPRPAQSADQAQ